MKSVGENKGTEEVLEGMAELNAHRKPKNTIRYNPETVQSNMIKTCLLKIDFNVDI